jgi:hypothetical protein
MRFVSKDTTATAGGDEDGRDLILELRFRAARTATSPLPIVVSAGRDHAVGGRGRLGAGGAGAMSDPLAPQSGDCPLSESEVRELIYAALSINDRLTIDDCGVAHFGGSQNDVEDFRETINRLWHRSVGWIERPEEAKR